MKESAAEEALSKNNGLGNIQHVYRTIQFELIKLTVIDINQHLSYHLRMTQAKEYQPQLTFDEDVVSIIVNGACFNAGAHDYLSHFGTVGDILKKNQS